MNKQLMRACVALIRVQMRLAMRERPVLFFNYIFPLIFFFGFGAFFGGRGMGAAMTRVVSMVIVLGILGSGLFGAGLRAVAEREQGILRRFKVAPISPLPILVASLVTGWVLYVPSAAMIILLAHFFYKMPLPTQPFALFVVITLGCFAFRSIGSIIASVANSMAESNILVQILYMPMLFLSGATFPVSAMPVSAQIASQFLPASYLNSGIQHVMLRSEGLGANLGSIGGLILTTLLATFISTRLFRWEKEEKLPGRAKAWVVAVFVPFILLGCWQAYSRDQVNTAKQLDRQIRRAQARLIRGGLVFTGDGRTFPNGAILIREGRIEQVFPTSPSDAEKLNAEIVEAAGKTIMPGLIDAQIQLSATAGLPDPTVADPTKGMERALAAYLYSGVTAVKTAGPATPELGVVERTVNSGTLLGSEVFAAIAPFERPFFLPALAASDRDPSHLINPLVEQVTPPEFLRSTIAAIKAGSLALPAQANSEARKRQLVESFQKGILLVMGTGSGQPGLFHGPAIHRELKLWVEAGIPPAAALQAATHNAAIFLGAERRIGLLEKGYDATFLVLDGNPLTDIGATERISSVFLKGERVARGDLFDQK